MYITLRNTLYHIIILPYKRLKYLLYQKKKKTFLCGVFYRDMQRDILKYPFFPYRVFMFTDISFSRKILIKY